MDASKYKAIHSNSTVQKSSIQQEKLRRRREINARYSRLTLSKTIKHFQSQGHVTISISEKCNDGRYSMKSMPLQEPKNKTISFWQLPKTLKCELQLETNNSKAMKSVRTQTNFTKNKKNSENDWYADPSNKNRSTNTTNEILSSKVSCDGNVMSLVMRSNHDEETDQKKFKQKPKRNHSPRSPRIPKRKFKSVNFLDRSKNFWASYNNIILCNRSIEVRITKLFSFQNTQYIVAFSENLFEDTYKISHESCYVTQFMMYNVEACIFQICLVKHIYDLKIIKGYTSIVHGSNSSYDVIENILQTVQYNTACITGEYCGRASNDDEINSEKKLTNWKRLVHSISTVVHNIWTKVSSLREPILEKNDCVVSLNSRGVVSNRQKYVAMKISGVAISLWVIYVSIRDYSYLFQ